MMFQTIIAIAVLAAFGINQILSSPLPDAQVRVPVPVPPPEPVILVDEVTNKQAPSQISKRVLSWRAQHNNVDQKEFKKDFTT